MTLQTFLLIVRLQSILFGLGAILSVIKYKARQTYIKLLGLTLFSSVVGNEAANVLHHYKISVNYSSTTFYLAIIPLISSVYFYAMNKQKRNAFIIVPCLYVAFALINVVFIQRSSINSYTLIIQSILVIILCLYYFYWLLEELPTSQLHRLPMFWINSAYMIFYSGNLFLFVFTSYLVNVLNNQLLVYWSLHNILGIIQATMMSIGLWMDLRNIKSPSSLLSVR